MKKKTLEQFIEQSRIKYGNLFDYSLAEYKGYHKPITLICSNAHIFQTIPVSHLSANSKGGCRICYDLNLFNNRKLKYTQITFINACNKIHNNTYEYTKTVYNRLQDKIIITCKIHGDFIQNAVYHLLNKNGCSKCGKIKSIKSRELSQEQIQNKIIKFNKIHNNKYTYGNIYRENNILLLELICPKHGVHTTRFFNHEKGHGCPKCVSVRSNVQIQWLNYRMIRDGFIQHSDNLGEYVIPNTKLYVDGYNKESNTIYEFQGDFWHGNPKIYDINKINTKLNITFGELYNKTLDKINKLQNLGYKVIYIWENDWTRGIKVIKKLQRIWKKSKFV